MIRSPHHVTLVKTIRDRVPGESGVYLFRGEDGEILYVGKAVNLRNRMLGHLHADPQNDEPRHTRMVFAIRDFEYETTSSELLALLREDELIKQHQPRFNVRQNEILEYKYLELTTDEFPRLCMIDHEDDFGGRQVFGPYRDRYLIDRILQLIHQYIGLRSCTDRNPVDKCLEFDLGHCVGPCREGVTAADYRQAVARSVAFLGGDVLEVVSKLRMAMGRASKSLDFEKAQELKERLDFCERFGERQRFLQEFREKKLVVKKAGEPPRTYTFLHGHLTDGSTQTTVSKAAGEDPRLLLDRATIVHSWLRRNAEKCEHRFS